jgi:hypothetical protein
MSQGENDRWIIMSALQKSIRWCEVNPTRFFAKRYMEIGYPGGALDRLISIAAEDVGLADPTLIEYLRDCRNRFDVLVEQKNIKLKDAIKHKCLFDIVDEAAIAAAVSFKSRLIAMLSFATLYEIYQKEKFSKNVYDYFNLFVDALNKNDEQMAVYYAYVIGIFLDKMPKLLTCIQRESYRRNQELIDQWVQEYEKRKERLSLVGSVVMLCRDLPFKHGEYKQKIYQYKSLPIQKAVIPDRAYDMHTRIGKKIKKRGFEHFFNVAATVKNERPELPNIYEIPGQNAYYSAVPLKLAKASKIIKKINEGLKLPGVLEVV